MASNIVVVGSLNMDLVVQTEQLPRPGMSVMGGRVTRFPGGRGGNQAVAAARLGGQVLMIGRVGRDENGEALIRSLEEEGVDTAFISRDPETPTGVAMITVDLSGQSTAVISPGANYQLLPGLLAEAHDVIRKADVLLLQLEIPIETVEYCAELAHQNGVTVVLNASPARPLSLSLLKNVDYLVMSQMEAGVLTSSPGDGLEAATAAASELAETGVHGVVVTLGKRGIYYHVDGQQGLLAPPAVNVVDRNGTGVAFLGALAVGLGSGLPALQSLCFASAAGALTATRRGLRSALPNRQQVEELLGEPIFAREEDGGG